MPQTIAPATLLVSVVVINHNYGRFLADAVGSALAQSHAAVEVVVVDDGSTDDSDRVLDALDPSVRQVRQACGGHVRAANAGFAASRGDIVILLDADDMLYPDCAARVVASWHPSLSKVQWRLDTIDGNGADLGLRFPAYASDLDPAEIRRRSLRSGYYPWPVSSGNAYARGYLAQVMPIDATRIFKSPDGFLNKMAPLHGEVATLRETLGAYRVHGANAWARSDAAATPADYARVVRFDAVLHQAFVERAGECGHEVGDYDVMPVVPWLEVRLLSLRLRPSAHPLPGDTRAGVLARALRGTWRADGVTPAGRLAWCAWFVALAVLPVRAVRAVVRQGRTQSRRSRLARLVVRVSRQA